MTRRGSFGALAAFRARMRYNTRAMANGLTYKRVSTTPEATKQLGATLAPYLQPNDVIVLTGDLGAGKTQFVQGVARGLGILELVVSPTFNIVLEYGNGRLPLYHFDWYRLQEAIELEDIGYYDLIDSGGVSFIEWGERFPMELPYGYLEISITADKGGNRTIVAHSYGERSRQLLFLWAKDSKSRLMRTS